MREHFEPTGEWFASAMFDDSPVELCPAELWTDDLWFADQDSRAPRANEGWWALREGEASGRLVGGNLCTLNLLQGTEFMPSLDGAVLLVEDDAASDDRTFARDLTSLLQLPDAEGIAGLVVGRFQAASGMTRAVLEEIVSRQQPLRGVPVLANVDYGHTNPSATVPLGGSAQLSVGTRSSLRVSHR